MTPLHLFPRIVKRTHLHQFAHPLPERRRRESHRIVIIAFYALNQQSSEALLDGQPSCHPWKSASSGSKTLQDDLPGWRTRLRDRDPLLNRHMLVMCSPVCVSSR